MSSRWVDRLSQALGLRLAAWYLGTFLASTLVIGGLTYGLLATLLETRDHDIIQSTLREYATRYQAGGLPALARAIEVEQRSGTREPLFVRVVGPFQDVLLYSLPETFGAFDLSELPGGAKSGVGALSLTTSVEPLGSRERLSWRCEPEKAARLVESAQFNDRSTAFFVVAYGATRRVEASTRVDESARAKSRLPRYERVSSLFEDHLALMPLSYWLPAYARRNPGRYTQVLHLLDDLLPSDCRIHRKASETDQGTEHLFSMNGVPLPFRHQ